MVKGEIVKILFRSIQLYHKAKREKMDWNKIAYLWTINSWLLKSFFRFWRRRRLQLLPFPTVTSCSPSYDQAGFIQRFHFCNRIVRSVFVLGESSQLELGNNFLKMLFQRKSKIVLALLTNVPSFMLTYRYVTYCSCYVALTCVNPL